MDTMFSLKVAQKNRLHSFFEKKFWKNAIFECFSFRSPISQNRDQMQSPWFRKLHKHFINLQFSLK